MPTSPFILHQGEQGEMGNPAKGELAGYAASSLFQLLLPFALSIHVTMP